MISKKNSKNRNLKLVLCGLENITDVSSFHDYVIFGNWMSEDATEDRKINVQLFPFNFDTKEIQTEDNLVEQDQKVVDLYEELIPLLTTSLNKLHDVALSSVQWEAVIGYWLRHFLDAVMVRWALVSSALELDLAHVYLADVSSLEAFPQPKSRDDFAYLCNSSKKWNQFIISKIANTQIENTQKSFSSETLRCLEEDKFIEGDLNKPLSRASHQVSLKNFTKFVIEGLSRLIPAKILIYSPTLTIIEKLKLALKLGKFPYLYFLKDYASIVSRDYSNHPIFLDANKRGYDADNNRVKNIRTCFEGIIDTDDLFASLIVEILPHSIPRCYVEEWSLLNKVLDDANLPENLDKIYVGSGIITDEILRLYVSRMMVKGTEFIISQHGGVYGFTLVPEKTEFIELRISNKWISWGWTSSITNKVVPGPALKGRLKISNNDSSEGMLIALPPVRFSPSRLNYSDPYEIVQSHVDFINSLDNFISSKVITRPAPNHREFSYVKDFETSFNVAKKGSFNDDLAKSKLFLCTHNATTMLEALRANFPTIIMLPKYKYYTQHYLRKDALPIIQEMKEVGIYFDDAIAARDKVHSIWSDVDAWWYSAEVQEVVNKFCKLYCRKDNNHLDSLVRVIND